MQKNNKSRETLGKNASIVGIVANVVLSISKIVIGAIFGFISVLADGFNNLSDCGSSVVSLISFKMSSKPADKEHPYGHERIEYISSMVVAFIILIIAFELLKESVLKIINPDTLEISIIVIIVLIFSILVKLSMFFFYRITGKKINSDLLKATSVDSLSDCIATSVVLISIIISYYTNINIDGYVGIVVAIFISIAGIKIVKEMISKLIGQAPDKEIFESVKKRILKHKEVLGIHDLNIYSYGPNKYFASVHIELDAQTNSLEAHELIDDIEREFSAETNILLTGHHDPIVTNDEEVNSMRKTVAEFVENINKNFSMHDFRMVKGPTKTNVIFEVAIPFDTQMKETEIVEILRKKITELNPKYKPVIMVEKQMFI